MPGYADPGFDTLSLHAGHAHRRVSNAITGELEQRVAALEGGIGAIATASGQAALHLSIATLMGAGSHIVASAALHTNALTLLSTLRRFGIDTTLVPASDVDAWRAAIQPNTKLLFGETVGTLGMEVLDIPTVAGIARAAGVPLLVDSTLTSPWLVQPLALGADVVYHSANPFLSGHGTVDGTVDGGVVVDGGSFDWARAYDASGKFAELAAPCDGFDGINFSEESTVGAFLLRARQEGLKSFGACMSPHTAGQIVQGIETLGLRMARHLSNTEAVVQCLVGHPLIGRVGHPLLESHPSHALARTLLPKGTGSVFSFDLKGSRKQCAVLLESLKLFTHTTNPTQSTIRLSVGLEDPADLVDDLLRALKMAEKAADKVGA